jgi:hypothetical protein
MMSSPLSRSHGVSPVVRTMLKALACATLSMTLAASHAQAPNQADTPSRGPVGNHTPPTPPQLTLRALAPYAATPNYVRFGAPIDFYTRILPADATGTLTYSIDGNPIQTVPLTQQTVGDYVALGDSISQARYIGDPTQRYPNIIAHDLNLVLHNESLIGDTACDLMPLQILYRGDGTAPAMSPLYSVLVGPSDFIGFGAGAHEKVFSLCHAAALTWIGILRKDKLLAGDPGITVTSGQWKRGPAPDSCCLEAYTTSTSGDRLQFNIKTNGAPAYLWYSIQTAPGGTFTVSTDGGPPSAPVATQSTPFSSTQQTSYGYARFPVPVGSHTFEITAQSGGQVTILGMGTPDKSGASKPPTILQGDIVNEINPPLADIAAYTADIQATVALLTGDGLDLRFVPTQSFMHATPAEMADFVHPNAVGLAEVAKAFETTLTQTGPVLDTVTVATGSFTTSTLPIGNHQIDVVYSGDENYTRATGTIIPFSIYDGTSSTTLAANASIVAPQAAIILTATVVQPQHGGEVIFSESTPAGNKELGRAQIIAQNKAVLTIPGLPSGPHTLLARYEGDLFLSPSDTAPLVVTVTNASSLQLAATPSTTTLGSALQLAASISPTQATGSVTFFDGSTSLGSAALVNGIASLNAPNLALGVHHLTATYAGDSLNLPATSVAVNATITAAPSSTALAITPSSSLLGSTLTATIRITTVPNAVPTGTVTLHSGATLLASGPVTNSVPGAASTTLTFASTPLGLGTVPLIATYSGDPSDQASDSPISTITLTPPPTAATLTLSAAQVPIEASVTLTANVTARFGTPTGIVNFLANGTTLGSAPLNSSGIATLVVSPAAIGTSTIDAAYVGTPQFPATTSAPQTLIVTAPLTAAISPTTLDAAPGSTQVATLQLTPLSGFSGAIQASCHTTSPYVTCALNAPATLNSATAIPVQITIAKSTIAQLSRPLPWGASAVLALLLPLAAPRRRRRLAALASVALLATVSLSGCATTGNFYQIPPGLQQVVVTVTGAATPIDATLSINITRQ